MLSDGGIVHEKIAVEYPIRLVSQGPQVVLKQPPYTEKFKKSVMYFVLIWEEQLLKHV